MMKYEIRELVQKVMTEMDYDAVFHIAEEHLVDYYKHKAGDWEIEDLIEEYEEIIKD